jgi:hypothetical protein
VHPIIIMAGQRTVTVLVRGTFDWRVLNEKGLTEIQTSKGPNAISVLPVSYRVIIGSVPWLM